MFNVQPEPKSGLIANNHLELSVSTCKWKKKIKNQFHLDLGFAKRLKVTTAGLWDYRKKKMNERENKAMQKDF